MHGASMCIYVTIMGRRALKGGGLLVVVWIDILASSRMEELVWMAVSHMWMGDAMLMLTRVHKIEHNMLNFHLF